jgi:hypothetical protein
LLRQLSEGPMTLLHGDYRTDNMMFAPDGTVIMMDFQLTGVGSAAYDLAYFIGSCLEVDAARERLLYDRWIDGLIAGGVPESDLAGMWEKYRIASLFCLVYPAVASRGMDLDVPRERELANVMMSRQPARRSTSTGCRCSTDARLETPPGREFGPGEVGSRCGERLGSVDRSLPILRLDPCWSPHRTRHHGRAAGSKRQGVLRPIPMNSPTSGR